AGVSRYRIMREVSGFQPYLQADVSWDGFERDLGKPEVDQKFDRPQFMKLLHRYFEAQDLSTDWDSLKDADEELLINSLSMLCPFEQEEKQALLEAPSLATRRETVVTLMEFALRGGGAGEEILQ
ncbi:MAG: ATP-dependent protease, partial [Jannaschia helgolandensis]|uniref:LON peptidase substrate-binding domain-containing protein n=1 Tax=Jannaschia helgolandensis TaxID=188906 RepID=UPI003C722DF2